MSQHKLKIKKGDQVIVLAGKDKGAKGEVLSVIKDRNCPDKTRIVVQGVNLVTKHNKPTQFSAGGIVKKELSIHISNVALVDPKGGAATRVGFKVLKDGKKVRVAKKSGETIE
jgi:large subunit ribosomal protein L24